MKRLRVLVLMVAVSCIAVAPAAPQDGTSSGAPGTVLITGANRGLGLEFVRQYAAGGWRVIATARDPGAASELRKLATGSSRVTASITTIAGNAPFVSA